MNPFLNLITGLKAHTVIIIENAFVYETDAEKALGKFCALPSKNQERLLGSLQAAGKADLPEQLKVFNDKFKASDRNIELEFQMPSTEYFNRYLVEIKATELGNEELIKTIAAVIESDSEDTVKNIFLKYGIYSSVDEGAYVELINLMKQVDGLSMLFYKAQPAESQEDEFFRDVDETVAATQSRFCLAIIDKKLQTGDSGNEGKTFIKNVLFPRNETSKTKIVCCLYTSTPEQQALENVEDYFIQEISKDSSDAYQIIAKTLANAAYAQVFSILTAQRVQSANKALAMVLRSQKNIKYIIEHSIGEGIPGFEAIKYWFNLAKEYQLDQQEIDSLDFITGILPFFDNQHLEDHPQMGTIGPDLLKLKSFELFDSNINKKFAPVAPGDIFKTGDTHYILMGQLCDIALRSNNTRKAKLGELLKIEFVECKPNSDKYFIDVKDGRKTITIQHFLMGDGAFKNIQIDVSTDTTEFAELSALDTVMFNSDGISTLDTTEGKVLDVFSFISANLTEYYELLRTKFVQLINLKNTSQIELSPILIREGVLFSCFTFTETDGLVNLGFTRVARLKGRYFDSVYNNFLNNKGRIDLNLIDNSPEVVSTATVTCSFLPDNSQSETIELNLWTFKGEDYFKKEELINILPATFTPLLKLCPQQIKSGTNQVKFIKKEDGSYDLGLKLLIKESLYLDKTDYSYKLLFDAATPENNIEFRVDGEDTDRSFQNDAGRIANPITLEQLKTGVIVYDKMVHLKLVNGILNWTKIED